MINVLIGLNYIMVFIFGLFLTAAFSGTLKNKKHRNGFVTFYILIFIIQAIIFFKVGGKTVEKLYPITTHFPLILFLVFYCKKNFPTAISAFVSAYLFTSPRHWLGSLISAMFGESILAFYITEILITIPMIILICRYMAPSICSILEEGGKGTWFFSAFLILYYLLTYATTVYSDILYTGNPVIIEFIFSAMVVFYFIFNLLYYKEVQQRTIAESDRQMMEINVHHAQDYIEKMNQSQEQITIYRHDLRHHMQYINFHLESGEILDVQKYIKSICMDVDAINIIKYCENKTVNMLLSSYVDKARKAGINCIVKTLIPNGIYHSPVDLCVIIGNSMENAINACLALEGKVQPIIWVNAYTKNQQLFYEITNPYRGDIKIEYDLPVSKNEGHGFGTKSIVMTVEKYKGIWAFEAKEGIFLMRVVL